MCQKHEKTTTNENRTFVSRPTEIIKCYFNTCLQMTSFSSKKSAIEKCVVETVCLRQHCQFQAQSVLFVMLANTVFI